MILEITFGYWVVVYPVMVRIKYVKNAVGWLSLSVAHLLPFLGVLIDLCFSSFQFYLRHVVVYFIFGLMYLGYHLFQTFYIRGPDKEPIYPAMNWYHKPLMASLLSVFMVFVYLVICLLLVKFSHIKIRRRFPGGQVIERISIKTDRIQQVQQPQQEDLNEDEDIVIDLPELKETHA